MKVYVFPADKTGCGRYRMTWPAEALRKQGLDVTVVAPEKRNSNLRGQLDPKTDKLVAIHPPRDADVMVLQRITHNYLVEGVTLLREMGISVVIDIDDDLSSIHPSNPAFMAMHPTHGTRKDHNWRNAERACAAASYSIVSTPALLKRYAPHSRGAVVRNCVPKRYLDIPHEDSAVIGWGGSVRSHPNDLQVMGSGLTQVLDETTFRIVGPSDLVKETLGLESEPDATGAMDLDTEWPEAISTLGIGIAPLADTAFNAAKSGLKPLEYSAVGVPWVASPRAEYSRLHKLGAGLLANKPRQWAAQLRLLIRDEVLREEMSDRGRQLASTMTIEENAWRWMEVWESAYKVDH